MPAGEVNENVGAVKTWTRIDRGPYRAVVERLGEPIYIAEEEGKAPIN